MLVVAVVAVAYGSAAPQLGVAEFAPAANKALEAPPTTSATPAAGERQGRRSTTTTVPAVTSTGPGQSAANSASPTTTVGRARQCFGSPPQQLPDPRSPACAPTIFEGDNGGATTAGVSATEIRVAWPTTSSGKATYQPGVTALFEYFNRHFELYGRHLVPVFVEYGTAADSPSQRALAAQVGGAGVFGALETHQVGRWYPAFFQELARQRVVTVAYGAYTMLSDRELFDPLHPYLWSVYPSLDQTWANLTDFACTALVGKPATHAGGALQGQPRKFGVFVAGYERLPKVRPIIDQLSACGADPVVAEWRAETPADQRRVAYQRLKDAGVTTVICACADNINTAGPRWAGSDIGWNDAEWLLPFFTGPEYDEYYVANEFTPAQRTHFFGLQPNPKVMPPQAQWWYGAIQETNPALQATAVNFTWAQAVYDELLVLAAGIQAAGPSLTPETFAAGLMTAAFPNTGAGAAPYWQPSVGFGLGDHGFYNDYGLVWWGEDAEFSGYQAASGRYRGSWCYLDRGARFSVGHYPSDADSRFFTEQPCR